MYTSTLVVVNRRPLHRGLFIVIFAWYCVSPAIALVSNRTIDDGLGDSVTGQKILFLPTTQGVWNNQNCVGCALNPDTTKAFGGTYTAATYNSGLGSISATLNFQGTAIYVFFILANSAPPGITTLRAVNFTLDDQPPVPKLHAPSVLTSDFQYDVMMWSQTGLPATQHTLVVSTSGVDNDVYVNFDYAIYTHDDEVVTPSASTRTPSAAMPSAIVPSTPMSPGLVSSPLGVSTTVFSAAGAAFTTEFSIVTSSTAMLSVPPISTTFLAPSDSPFPSTLKSDNNDEVSSSHRGVIAGGAAGGALLVLAFVLAIFYVCRRYRQRNNPRQLTAKPIISNIQGGPQTLQSPSSITPFPNSSRSMLRSAATFSEDSNVFISRKSGRAHRPVEQNSPPLSFVGTNDNSAAVSPQHSEDLRRARQEELNNQLAARQEAIRDLSSDLDSITNRPDSDVSGKDIRQVSVRTLRRLRSLAGHDAPQQEGSGGQLVTAGDFSARGAEGATEVNVTELQELNRLLRLEIEFLKLQQQSTWAQGLSDDPPPGYTPSAPRGQQA